VGRGTVYPFVLKMLLTRLRPGMRVLETGCGGAQYRPHVKAARAAYVGTDVVNSHYQDRGDVDVYCSAHHLPFPAGSFDLVFNQGAIDYMASPASVFREAYRVLKPNGMVLIFTYTRKVLEDIHANCVSSGRPWEKDHWVFDRDEILQLIRTAGFSTRDVSARLETWSPTTRLEHLYLALTRRLASIRLANSHWRAYEGTRSG
jgi:SAM-dependent methyltransferase